MADNVNHPAHYTQYKHEVIELTSLFDFCTGNALKYLLRYKWKGGAEDLKKAQWYLNRCASDPATVWCRGIRSSVRKLARTFNNTLVSDIVDGVTDSAEMIPSTMKRAADALQMIIDVAEEKRPEDERQLYFPFWYYSSFPCDEDVRTVPGDTASRPLHVTSTVACGADPNDSVSNLVKRIFKEL